MFIEFGFVFYVESSKRFVLLFSSCLVSPSPPLLKILCLPLDFLKFSVLVWAPLKSSGETQWPRTWAREKKSKEGEIFLANIRIVFMGIKVRELGSFTTVGGSF